MFNLFVAGHPLIKLQSIDSTNNYAAKLVRKHKLAEGTVIMSDFQLAGKGQRGNNWESVKGKNLLLSIVLFPRFLAIEKQYLLSMIISLSVYHVMVDKTVGNVKIKWPNDVLINRKKVGGILIENTSVGKRLDSSIVGIGLNVNQGEFISDKATSLLLETGLEYELFNTLELLLENIDRYYHLLKFGGSHEVIRQEYLRHMYQLNQPAFYQYEGKEIRAEIAGISSLGMLEMVDLSNNRNFECDIKEVVYL